MAEDGADVKPILGLIIWTPSAKTSVVDTTDRPIVLVPYASSYGRLRTPEEQAKDNRESCRDALERIHPTPAPTRHRLRPAGMESTSKDDSKEE